MRRMYKKIKIFCQMWMNSFNFSPNIFTKTNYKLPRYFSCEYDGKNLVGYQWAFSFIVKLIVKRFPALFTLMLDSDSAAECCFYDSDKCFWFLQVLGLWWTVLWHMGGVRCNVFYGLHPQPLCHLVGPIHTHQGSLEVIIFNVIGLSKWYWLASKIYLRGKRMQFST